MSRNAPILNERAQLLLKALVELSSTDGQPVGSRALSRVSGLDLSPASVRNVMADLEEMGFIASPHPSAGRVPTSRGYRVFVDTLMTVKPLDRVDLAQLQGNLHPDHPQRVISQASQLLSELTHFAGIVIATRRKDPAFRHLEFLRLSDKRVLLIIVAPDGDVQNRILFTDHDYSQSELTAAGNFINEHYAGMTLAEIRRRIHEELNQLRADMTALMSAALEASSQALRESSETYVISGERNLLDSADLASNMARLRELFALFEKKTELMQILDVSTRAAGVQIFIGGEAGIASLDECSAIAPPPRGARRAPPLPGGARCPRPPEGGGGPGGGRGGRSPPAAPPPLGGRGDHAA